MTLFWCLRKDPFAILILISPTNLLGKAQQALVRTAHPDITCLWFDSAGDIKHQQEELKEGRVRIVIISTESACAPWFKKMVTTIPFWKSHLKGVIVDEAHLSLVWDFMEWRWICELLRGSIKFMVLSGTVMITNETKLCRVFGLKAAHVNTIRMPIARLEVYRCLQWSEAA
jgi:superfamily II DNA helicase RecQ